MTLFGSTDVGIDLGTSSILVYAKDRGIVLNEPSVAAVERAGGKLVAVGREAEQILGRAPQDIAVIRPLRDGVISNFDVTARMMRYFFKKVIKNSVFYRPRVVVCVPSGVTEAEKRCVVEAAKEAGARHCYLIEEPVAAAIGAGLDIQKPSGTMIVDIGGGTTDIGVLSMNGVASSASIKVAGIAFDEAIVKYVRKHYGLVIGSNTAEDVKISIGCVWQRPETLSMSVKGRDLKTGLAREIVLTSDEIVESLKRPARLITDKVLDVLELTTPELVADISQNGIVLTGGGSQIYGMDLLLTERTGVRCTLADDAASCVVYGCGKSLAWIGQMTEGPINVARKRLLNSRR